MCEMMKEFVGGFANSIQGNDAKDIARLVLMGKTEDYLRKRFALFVANNHKLVPIFDVGGKELGEELGKKMEQKIDICFFDRKKGDIEGHIADRWNNNYREDLEKLAGKVTSLQDFFSCGTAEDVVTFLEEAGEMRRFNRYLTIWQQSKLAIKHMVEAKFFCNRKKKWFECDGVRDNLISLGKQVKEKDGDSHGGFLIQGDQVDKNIYGLAFIFYVNYPVVAEKNLSREEFLEEFVNLAMNLNGIEGFNNMEVVQLNNVFEDLFVETQPLGWEYKVSFDIALLKRQ